MYVGTCNLEESNIVHDCLVCLWITEVYTSSQNIYGTSVAYVGTYVAGNPRYLDAYVGSL